MDLQYHDLRPEKSLSPGASACARWSTDAEVDGPSTEPPRRHPGLVPGPCLQRFSADIVAANWDSMVFDVGRSPLRRVPMMEPTRGTKAHVGSLIAESRHGQPSCWSVSGTDEHGA